jgi:adenylyltransferase/sulfurtransferase
MTFVNEERERYARHFLLKEVGEEGQKKLKQSKVLIVGSGGLGAPLALYLAAAGIGRIGLVDFDVVDRSNLQRQILFGESDLGVSKLEAAKKRLADLNPNIELVLHHVQLCADNAFEILSQYDIIADGTDNFATRYLVNDACVLLRKPNVYGSIYRFEGQVSVFDATRGPCYRCIYPEPPPPHLIPNCAEAGVIGALPGIVGSLQAMEVIKLSANIGKNLIGRLMLFDGLTMQFQELKFSRNDRCPVCGDKPKIKTLKDTELNCGVENMFFRRNNNDEIDVVELKRKLDEKEDFLLLDVREPLELAICKLDQAVHIPMKLLPEQLHKLQKDKEIVVMCRSGSRSLHVQSFLKSQGFTNVKNLKGGILDWARKIDPNMQSY